MRNLAESFSLTVVSLKSESAAEYLKHFIFFLILILVVFFLNLLLLFIEAKKMKEERMDR